MVVLLVKAIIIKLFKDAATDAFLKQVMRYRKIQEDTGRCKQKSYNFHNYSASAFKERELFLHYFSINASKYLFRTHKWPNFRCQNIDFIVSIFFILQL